MERSQKHDLNRKIYDLKMKIQQIKAQLIELDYERNVDTKIMVAYAKEELHIFDEDS